MKYLTSKKKSLKNWTIYLFLIFLLLTFYVYYFVKSSLAPMDGTLNLQNLSSSVSVIRDQFGIPHIKAKNTKDAFRALGFVVASERLFQMEMQRRMANGELSEIFGRRMLSTDKLFRTLGLRQSMSEMLEQKIKNNSIDKNMWSELEAFYDGVNQYQDLNHLPIEFTILGITPRPFSALDGYAFIGLMSFSFGVATSEDPLMTKLKAQFGEELSNELRNEVPPSKGSKIKNENNIIQKLKKIVNAPDRYPVMKIFSDLERGFSLFEGSNGWIVSGKRSVSGFPILANDPHITYGQPGVWFEAHIETPDYTSYGHFLSVLPFPILSHNKDRGWGLTMSLIDDMDLYREKLSSKFKSYQFKNLAIPYNERLEIIKIKKEKPFTMLVIRTQHGPIMDEVFPHLSDKSLALKWAFLGNENDPLLSLYKMGKAKNIEEFKNAVASGRAPGLNVLYADKKNIGQWIFGEVAVKSNNRSSDFILDGASGLDEYKGFLNFNQKTHLENPSSGVIISANSRPLGIPDFPSDIRGDWQSDDRYKSIDSILSKKEKWSIQEFMEVQTLSLNKENKLLLDELLKNTEFKNIWNKERARPYLKVLNKWNFVSDIHSIAPSLYYTWCREISKILLKELTAEEFEAFSKLPNNWNFFKRVILNSNSLWWKKFDRKKVVSDGFNNMIDSLREELGEDLEAWEWGHLHTVEFMHPIGKIAPFNKIFNIGPYEISGAANEINNQKPSGYTESFKVRAGPSTRRIISFDHPEIAWGILPSGNSGHLLSPFYKDQVKLFTKGVYREEWLDEKDIFSHKSHELILMPNK